jgi:hypothetical protein
MRALVERFGLRVMTLLAIEISENPECIGMRSGLHPQARLGQLDETLRQRNGLVILAGLIKLPNLPVKRG